MPSILCERYRLFYRAIAPDQQPQQDDPADLTRDREKQRRRRFFNRGCTFVKYRRENRVGTGRENHREQLAPIEPAADQPIQIAPGLPVILVRRFRRFDTLCVFETLAAISTDVESWRIALSALFALKLDLLRRFAHIRTSGSALQSLKYSSLFGNFRRARLEIVAFRKIARSRGPDGARRESWFGHPARGPLRPRPHRRGGRWL